MSDVDHGASVRTICASGEIPLHSSPVSAARFHGAGLVTGEPRIADGTILAAIPRAPAWNTFWELRAATGATDVAIRAELRRQMGAGRVRAGVLATCWQRRRAKVGRPGSGR